MIELKAEELLKICKKSSVPVSLLVKLQGKKYCRLGLTEGLVGFHLFKLGNGNSRTRCEICLKLTIKILQRPDWRSGALILDLTDYSVISMVGFDQVNSSWGRVVFAVFCSASKDFMETLQAFWESFEHHKETWKQLELIFFVLFRMVLEFKVDFRYILWPSWWLECIWNIVSH